MLRRILAIALVSLLALPGLAAALSVTEVARELRCPTCNAPLDVSNSPVAGDMKRIIGEYIREGRSKDEILELMVADFGPEVLATPPKSGFSLVVWVVPFAVLLAGLIAVPLVARAWSRGRAGPAAGPALSPEDRARVDDELRRLGD
ncbi:MAG: cytochrome c-type biogenesis protein CcmH [Miltoncostaeaceae bacterium]